jgi:hypothetical protein
VETRTVGSNRKGLAFILLDKIINGRDEFSIYVEDKGTSVFAACDEPITLKKKALY